MLERKKNSLENFYNIFLAIGSTIAAIVIIVFFGEIYLRLFPTNHKISSARPRNIGDMWQSESEIGYINKGNFKLNGKNWWNCNEKLSSKGTRGREFEKTKPKGTYRILGLGDSVGFGIGLCEEKTFLGLLDKKLNSDIDRKIEVINASVSGYCTMQEYLFLLKYGQSWNPDMVIITLCPNDLYASEDPFSLHKFIRPIPEHSEKVEDTQKKQESKQKDTLVFKSKFFDFVKYSLKAGLRRFGWVRRDYIYVDSISEGKKYDYQYFDVLAKKHELIAAYKKIIELCRKKNIELVVIHIPYSITFHRRILTKSNSAIKLFKKNNVTYLDFFDIFRKTIFKKSFLTFYKPALYLPDDPCHLNELGHRMVSEYLYNMLKGKISERTFEKQ